MTGILRNLAAEVTSLLLSFPAVAMIGARQVGKTTLAKQIAQARGDWRYFDLENPRDYDRISYDPDFFLEENPRHLIFDEVHYYPELMKSLRGAIDARREEKGQFILTGSSSPELLQHLTETLAGRVAIVEVGTLKANEYYHRSLSPFYDIFTAKLSRENLSLPKTPPCSRAEIQQVWLKGGYPEPLLDGSELFHAKWMENYRNTYINRDITRLFPRLNKVAFRNFLTILSSLSGTIINRSDVARALEISEGSVREYLKIAEGTFIWRNLPSFERNVMKAVVKMEKGFIRDTGLLHNFLRINDLDSLYQHPIIGKSFEIFVIEEIIKGLQATTAATNWQSYYYRTRGGAEIDLLLDGPFGLLPIEIKHGTTISARQIAPLKQFVNEHNLPYGMLINQSEEVIWVDPKIVMVGVGWI